MVDWRKLEAAVDRKIGGAFGERVRLSFMKNGKLDPERPQIIVRCETLCEGGDDSKPIGVGQAGVFRSRLAAGEAELFLDRGSYDGPKLQPGDAVRAIDRQGEPVWEVGFISDRYSNLIVAVLREK
ncbi:MULTISPECIES: hypothetical protein [Rhizobium]|uniref:Uncharacterized protein n=1 Tax=Rhizobium paranaense TaxID=1650438 RepID=A0A7W9D3H2_9HYPH|nr:MULTISPECIES: hypothetical protein [Rhizobium]MBB5576377.1 hypothetical protein [Rhizobium paranaense]PST62584.1 hypothetical protein C9E91_13665 [Rhizobium sp. SEMIA4064]